MKKMTHAPCFLATTLIFCLPTFIGCDAEKGNSADSASSDSELEKGKKKCHDPNSKKGKKGKKGKVCQPPDPADASTGDPTDASTGDPTDGSIGDPPDASTGDPTDGSTGDPTGCTNSDDGSQGFACTDFTGETCDQAVEKMGYTQDEEDWILANCQEACGICTTP